MSIRPLNDIGEHAEYRASRTGDVGPSPRRRMIRTAAIMLAAGWLSALPNPTGSAPLSQPPAANPASPESTPRFAIPLSLLEEHAELHTAFETAARLPGETGAAARRVVALRAAHVAKEHRIAYPLLRLLPTLESGPVEPWMTELLPLSDQLRAALPGFKQEHAEIVRALEALRAGAWAEGHPEYAFLAQRLKHHIRIEEDILYPAALVTAEYVRTMKGTARDIDRP